MALTKEWLKTERPNSIGGVQRIYDMGHGWTLSAINSPMAHSYEYAWEFAVVGPEGVLEYGTELRRARAYFDEKGETLPFTTRKQKKQKREKMMESMRKFIREEKSS